MTTEDISLSLNITSKPAPTKNKKAQKKKKPFNIKRQPKVKEDLLQRTLLAREKLDHANKTAVGNVNKPSNENKLPTLIPTRRDLEKYINQTIGESKSKNVGKIKNKVSSDTLQKPDDSEGGKQFSKKQKRSADLDTDVQSSKRQKFDNQDFDTAHEVKDNKYKKNFNKKASNTQSGKTSSLFGNNPEIPKIGQRLVKPIKEEIFSGSKFSDLPIHPHSIKNLADVLNITELTSIQKKAFPSLLEGFDALIRSQTGSGKTLTYALPIIEKLQAVRPKLNRSDGIRALIIVPTRELALQTYELLIKLVKPFTWIVPGYLVGGEKRKAEKARLRKGITVLIGTPGRLIDHVQNTNSVKLDKVKFLVLDEADRMLDMGYEKDVKSLLEALESHRNASTYDPIALLKNSVKKFKDGDDDEQIEASEEINKEITEDEKSNSISVEELNKRRLQTVLLSATLSPKVQKLAGLTLTDPKNIDVSAEIFDQQLTSAQIPIKEGDLTTGLDLEQFVIPDSVTQSYVVIPPKLRLVTLSSFIIGKANKNCKILIFMATQDMIDFHTELLSAILVRGENDKDIDIDSDAEVETEDSEIKDSDSGSESDNENTSSCLVNVQFFKLHGSMNQKERTDVFKTFRSVKTGVLFCTDVAARGLDLPLVDCVVQYTGPTTAADYVHRVGRTARAGAKGEAIIFLSPTELEFVRLLESRRIRFKQTKMDLSNLSVALDNVSSSSEEAATVLQQRFENAVLESKQLKDMAYKAYSSWVRFYACYPKDMRKCFSMKDVHLGHYAKSFALRDPPSAIGGVGHRFANKNNQSKKFSARKGGPNARNNQRDGNKQQGRTQRLIVSEFESGLPSKKKKHK